jgi:hypothetical protein
MGYESRSRWRAVRATALLALLAGCQSCGHHKGATVNADLDAVPAQPRHVAVAFRSWAGSSQALIAAAGDLLEGTKLFEPKGGPILWFEDGAPSGYHVVGGFLYRTSAPVAQILGLIRAVEERIGGGRPAAPGGFLAGEILWVEGVHAQAPEIQLPSPHILGTLWGLNAFMASAEDPFAEACGSGREDIEFCRAVDRKFRHEKVPQVFETPVGMWISGWFKDGALTSIADAHVGDDEILAAAFDALVAGDAARGIIEKDASAAHILYRLAAEVVEKRPTEEVLPFNITLPPGPAPSRVKRWLEAISHEVQRQAIVPKRAVVFSSDDGHVRAALLGARTGGGSSPPGPMIPVLSVAVNGGGGAPGEPRGWRIVLEHPHPRVAKP